MQPILLKLRSVRKIVAKYACSTREMCVVRYINDSTLFDDRPHSCAGAVMPPRYRIVDSINQCRGVGQ
jgi:hypothetical protein